MAWLFLGAVLYARSRKAHTMSVVQATGNTNERGEYACLLEGHHPELAKFTVTFAQMAASNCDSAGHMWFSHWVQLKFPFLEEGLK